MGPNLIFDKSFLQSLSIDESVWLDCFFYSIITPLFFAETLADLEKNIKDGRTPEQVVGNLAEKTPDTSCIANMHHRHLLLGELVGGGMVDMKYGRPIVGGGTPSQVDSQSGFVFEQSSEEEALDRWKRREFMEIEKKHAKEWRRGLSLIPTKDQKAMFPKWYGTERPVNLATVKAEADKFIDGDNKRSALSFGLSLLNFQHSDQTKVMRRWDEAGRPALRTFAPYFRYVYGIDLFFYLARSADLISPRKSNRIDIAYLYYLPFCMVFTSNDKLHRETAPLFLREDQTFVWGNDLKDDLNLLDRHYSDLPQETKARGLFHFASQPPNNKSFLVTDLWDKHMRSDWRNMDSQKNQANKGGEFEDNLIKTIQRAVEAASDNSASPDVNADDMDFVITKHSVAKRKGKWNRLPVDSGDDDFHG